MPFVIRPLIRPLILAALALSLAGLSAPAFAIESHPGISAESLYSEAVLAFNKRQMKDALRILDDLLKTSPEHLEGLELMALTLKSEGNDKRAQEIYDRLLKVKPELERGPYHFELGVIHNKSKKPELARPHFQKAIELNFNEVPAHLFLGLIEFNAGNSAGALPHFERVSDGGNAEMKTVALYYLGLIHFKNGNGPAGTYAMTAVRTSASDAPDSKMAADLRAAAEKILAPFNNSQWFGSLTLMGQYDSNISTMPTVLASTYASKKSTPNTVLNGGFGYMSSPVDDLQWVPSYRLSFNKTLNKETADYDFLTHIGSLYLNFRPLNPTAAGLKLESSFAFQNQQNIPGDSSSGRVLRKYSLSGEGGLFFRMDFDKTFLIQLDGSAKKITNYADPGLTTLVASGKLLLKFGAVSAIFHPSGTLSYEDNRATSNDSRSRTIGAGISNAIQLDTSDTATLSADFALINYPVHSQARADKNLSFRLSYIHVLTPKWSLVADGSYMVNSSTVPNSYSYNRFTVGAGMGFTL